MRSTVSKRVDVVELEGALDAGGGRGASRAPRPSRGRRERSSRGRRCSSPARRATCRRGRPSHICSTMFICEVLTVTVTWSGLGSSSASMWRVSSDSHLAAAPSVSGANEIEPPTCRTMSGTATRRRAEQLVELRQALGALAVQLAHVHVQHGGAGVVAVHRLLHLLVHRHRRCPRGSPTASTPGP